MSEIKVNTDDLRNNASTFNTEAQNLNNALSELLSVINSLDLGKYQSQLSDRVRLRVTPIQDDTLRYQGRLAELADQLKNKAQAFEQANAANAADTAQLSNQMYDFANSSAEMTASATLKKMNDPKSNRIWTYSGSVFGNIIDWFTRIFVKDNSPKESLNETLYINCRLNLRQSPGLQSTIQRVLKPGETVTLESSEVFYEYPHAWVKVKDSSGEIGWIAKDVLGYQEKEKNTFPVTNQNNTTSEKINSNQVSNLPVQGGNVSISYGIHLSGGGKGVAIDLISDIKENARIHSIYSGRVIEVGPMTKKDENGVVVLDENGVPDLDGYGNYIAILQDDNKVVYYAHLKEQPSDIKVGMEIAKGQEIGNMGNTGYVIDLGGGGYHLHLEFRDPEFDDGGNFKGTTDRLPKEGFDPFVYLKELGIEF